MSPVRKLAVEGFRAFSERRELDFGFGSRTGNLCIFGENGTGKTSIADAIEFLTSDKGTVERLGEKPSENQAGSTALLHRGSLRKGRPGRVSLECCDGRVLERTVSTAAKAAKPSAEIEAVVMSAPVPFLLRFTEMRRFVADRKGKERYEQLAQWIGLERLIELQDALTAVDSKLLKQNRSEAKEEHERALTKLTGGAVKTWNDADVCRWLNDTRLTETKVTVKTAKDLERAAETLAELRAAEEQRSGVDEVRRYRQAIQALLSSNASEQLRAATEAHTKAVEHERVIRSSIDAAPMREVWLATRDYLAHTPAGSCPACFRSFGGETTRDAVLARLEESIAQLASVDQAEQQRKNAAAALIARVRAVDNGVRAIISSPGAVEKRVQTFVSSVASLRAATESWLAAATAGEISTPMFGPFVDTLNKAGTDALAICDQFIDESSKRTATRYEEIDREIKRLIEIRDDWARLVRQEAELSRALEQFRAVAEVIRTRIHQYITKVLGDLEADVRAIYAVLRRNDGDVPVVSVRVQEKSMSIVLDLFGEKEMVPSSYLSDSQLNSLGLALYVASLRKFNKTFPFVVLDDVMSSYDASHRLNLIEVIRDFLGEFQVVLTTHDEPFYRQVRTILNGKNGWRFYRLQPYKFETGLRFRQDRETPDELKRRIDEGEQPEVLAQIVMSDLETWLLMLCAEGNASVKLPIKKDLTPAEPAMSALWSAAQACFDDEDRKHPSYAFVAGHGLLNWPRHGATQAAMSITTSEIQTFYEHLEQFRAHYESRKGH